MKRIIFLLSLLAAALAACSPGGDGKSPVVLTLTGQLAETNRGAVSPREDLFLNWLGAESERVFEFTAADLAALPQTTVAADYPAGGPEHSFTGPRLSAVLEAAGARGEIVTAVALDGYGADIPRALIDEYDVILATHRDGAPLKLGGFGPAQVVFPRAEAQALRGMDDSLWVWGVVWMEAGDE